ncbi:hypothetical protein EJB05_52455, partial [Eragrostis curvula]
LAAPCSPPSPKPICVLGHGRDSPFLALCRSPCTAAPPLVALHSCALQFLSAPCTPVPARSSTPNTPSLPFSARPAGRAAGALHNSLRANQYLSPPPPPPPPPPQHHLLLSPPSPISVRELSDGLDPNLCRLVIFERKKGLPDLRFKLLSLIEYMIYFMKNQNNWSLFVSEKTKRDELKDSIVELS